MRAIDRRPMLETYFKQVHQFPLMHITCDDHLASALAIADDLLARELDPGEEAYLNVLTTLIHTYEREHHTIADVTPAEVLRELADADGLTGVAMAHQSGIAPSTISALMSGKRRPTPEQMKALAAIFNVNSSVFLPAAQPTRQENP
jgi:antitoxin component HigA of HigAB toxin-antitoxin module